MSRYQLRDMRAHVLYEGDTRPRYDAAAMQWVTPARIVAAPAPEMYCIVEVLESPAPAVARTLTHKQYMDRFTQAELEGIYGAAADNIAVQVWLKRFELADDVSLDDPLTLQGLNDMQAANLLAKGRPAEILA